MVTQKTLGYAFRRLFPALLAGLVAAIFCLGPCRADDLYNWSPVKIGAGGFVTGFVTHPLDPTVRYCRTDVGNAYRWDNSAKQWTPMVISSPTAPFGLNAPAPAATGVESLAVDPRNTQIVYMAFAPAYSSDFAAQYAGVIATYPAINGTVYKSTDGGRTFTAGDLSIDMQANTVNWRSVGERMAVDPSNSSVIYYGSNDNGLWRSVNGGAHWSRVTGGGAPDSSKVILNIRFDPISKAVYAVIYNGGVFRSADGGASWTDIAAGTALEGSSSFSAVSPDGSLWVIQNNTTNAWHYSGGAWTSTSINFGWGGAASAVTVDPKNSSRLWAVSLGGALSRTDNGGQLWNPCNHQFFFANTLAWLPQTPLGYRSNGGIFYDSAGALWVPEGNEGILTYTPTNTETNTDAGAPRWTIQSQGIEEFVTHDVIMPPGGKIITAVEDATGFVITDPARFTAVQIPLQNQTISNGTGVAYCPNASNSLAIVSADINFTGPGANFSGYSLDGGTSWHPFASYPADGSANLPRQAGSIAISRRNGWGDGGDHLVWVPTGNFPAYWSRDGGQSWHPSTGFPVGSGYWTFSLKQRALKADPFVADKFYYVASWGGGCYQSTDGGQTWAKTSGTTLPIQTHHGQLDVNRAVQNDLWYVNGWEGGAPVHGLWHSADGGTTFANTNAFDFAITVALGKGSGFAGDQPYSVYVYGRRTGDPAWGVFRSNNGGGSWVRVSYYPTGIFDQPTCLAASWDTYGYVTLGFNGNSFVCGKVTGSAGGGGGGGGVSVPLAPTGLAATAGPGQVTLSWSAPGGAVSSYTLFRGTAPGGEGTTPYKTGLTGTAYTDTAVTSGTTYSYQIAAVNSAGTGPLSSEASAAPKSAVTGGGGLDPLLTGTEFDDGAGPWGGSAANAAPKALDGSLSTFYDSAAASGGFVGIDLGAGKSAQVTAIRFAPRPGWPGRTLGGIFQGSPDKTTWSTLATVASEPPAGQYATLTVTGAGPCRYLRYFSPSGSNCDVAEIEFHGKASAAGTGTYTKLYGTVIGTPGSWSGGGNTIAKVFDGDTGTFFDAAGPDGNWAGLDLGSAKTITRIQYAPRPNWAARMVGGVFQGSNDSANWTTLATVSAAPPSNALTATTGLSSAAAYRYVRYLAPSGTYGNVAEVEFDASP